MKLDLFSRLIELAIILYSSDFNQTGINTIKKLYTDFYARLNSKAYKVAHKEAFIKGPVHMKAFFGAAITDSTDMTNIDLTKVSVNLQSLIIDSLIVDFDKNGDFFKGYNAADKTAMMMTLIGLDQLLLVSQFEFGTKAVDAILHGKHANKSQWWAIMELNNFSDDAFLLSDKLLKTTKNSNLSHELNGASALFPTNMTYARFSEIVKGSSTGLSVLQEQFNLVKGDSFTLRSNLSEPAHNIITLVLDNYMFHIMVFVGTEAYRFGNFYIGYYNFWRYNNTVLYNNMAKIIDVK